ncbi:hypothetical protein JG688_00006263 [Phytophthora aleatoria]|uniref:Zinc finger PHD-type domain-containing protein n=1 Tax=Phytophthora aleatoria TaxID=2496075 RepID=A0A8J5J162_9STRA|nr:hypothetical protein JG688_00006263 [Phytophthora aleatoria]
MLSVPLMLFRGGDASLGSEIRVLAARSKAPAGEWVGRFLTGLGSHFSALRELKKLPLEIKSSDMEESIQQSDKGGDDQKKKDDEDGDGHSSDSSSDSSADESDQEDDDGVMIDTDDEKDKAHNEVDPTDDDLSESDGSSDLENSYPRLPSAPVDTLIAFRQRAAHKELQMSEELKKEVIADSKQRHQERQQALRSKKKKKSPQSKRRHSKQSDEITNGSNHTNGSTGTAETAEDEWMVDCSCGLKEKNYDDGTSMIQCDSCSHWVHAKCADKQPEAVAQEKFLCFRA